MKISEHILKEAKQIVDRGDSLPQQITSAPAFFVAEGSDKTILAFGALLHNGKSYKIGTQKE